MIFVLYIYLQSTENDDDNDKTMQEREPSASGFFLYILSVDHITQF